MNPDGRDSTHKLDPIQDLHFQVVRKTNSFLEQDLPRKKEPPSPRGILKGVKTEGIEGGKGKGRVKPKEAGKSRKVDQARTRSQRYDDYILGPIPKERTSMSGI